MKNSAEILAFALCSCVIAAVLGIAKGISWKICVPVSAVFFVGCIIINIIQEHGNQKSFKTAASLENGVAFKNERQQTKYSKWKERDHTERPKDTMLADIIARYRSRSIVWEFVGAAALGMILIIAYAEIENAVRYILVGGIILLIYFGCSDICGIRARRLYNAVSERPDFEAIERSYAESTLIGIPKNYISVSSKYIILLTPKMVIPIYRENIAFIRRAYVIGNPSYNGAASSGISDAEKYFIRVYLNTAADHNAFSPPPYWCVMLGKFKTELAFEALENSGYPTDHSIDAR